MLKERIFALQEKIDEKFTYIYGILDPYKHCVLDVSQKENEINIDN